MALAMIGGILAATFLTLLFLPALYVAWFRVKEPKAAAEQTADHLRNADLDSAFASRTFAQN
jgi:hypothetical protein